MSIITAVPGIKRSVVYPFCFLPFLGLFFYEIGHHIFCNIEFVSIWWPCLVVFRLHGNDAGVSGLLFSDFLWFFFTAQTEPHKPGNLFNAKRTKRGWPKPYGFFLFCFFFLSVCEINWNWHCLKTLYIPFGDSQVRIKKSGKGEDLLTATALGWG